MIERSIHGGVEREKIDHITFSAWSDAAVDRLFRRIQCHESPYRTDEERNGHELFQV